ncbi:serine hydrolase domain-containing protein [Actinomyces timonensis]|uniref:Serine hydrolase domain-containing protein n=1 Tax=Actinomyces timonensis TaxID=1288391 RepID=A0AAU8N571_9ACTO
MTNNSIPALGLFDFPTALVVTEGGRIIAEAGDLGAVFPLASVTKPIVAWSALIAVERGMLGLDDPAGEGLDGATIRHLLAHASGVAPDSGEALAAPGTRRVYSNRGIEILGRRLAEATATDLESWVETTVLEPLGMASVLIPGSPAHSGQGNARDLSVFARELAAPRLLGAGLAEQARTPVYPGLAGVLPGYGRQNPNPFGLGMEIRGDKQPHWTGTGNSPATFGHFGQSGAFLWVDPAAGRQAVFLGERPFSQAHRRTWTALNDQVLALP